MATYQKVNDFVADVHNGVHNLSSDQLIVILSNTAPTSETSDPTADGNGVVANVTQISYTNISGTDPRFITTISSTQTSGTYSLILEDLTLTASGGAIPDFQYVYIGNNTAAGTPLIGYYGNGNAISIADGNEFKLDLSQVNGLFQTS